MIKEFIPKHISNKIVLSILSFLTHVSFISNATIKEHSMRNGQCIKAHLTRGFIEDQYKWIDVQYGKKNISYSGCEIIAVYNALYSLNIEVNAKFLVELISYFEKKGTVLNGRWGTSPNAVLKYLRKRGFEAEILINDDINQLKQIENKYDTFIVTVYNDRYDITKQIHTVNISRNNGAYQIHNVYFKDEKGNPIPKNRDFSGKTIRDLSVAVENISASNCKMISLIGISANQKI